MAKPPPPRPELGLATVRRARMALRGLLYAAITLPMMPLQGLAVALRLPLRDSLPPVYHRLCCRILGIEVVSEGTRSTERPVLFVSNHISYLDIPILASLGPVSFVAKSEVSTWPFISWLAKLQRTVFVDRRRGSTGRQRDAIRERLAAGSALMLFAEGTSGNGNMVMPFKSALFAAAAVSDTDGPEVTVQPVTIAYERLDGVPIGRSFRPLFAWYGDMALGPHLLAFLGLGHVRVRVIFHEPTSLGQAGGRRQLAQAAEASVRAGLAQALAGRALAGRAAAAEGVALQAP